jgi:hypothetical protein
MNIKCIILFSLFLSSLRADIKKYWIKTSSPENKNLEIVVRIPNTFNAFQHDSTRIMVLFGGRNWKADKTIKRYGFNKLADKHKLFLVSFSFKDDNYWHPDKWSGKAMLNALKMISEKYGINENVKILYYGYSAGAQCANLFARWRPKIILAWGVHACGVWHKPVHTLKNVPALITCGIYDTGRWHLSRNFIYRARKNGYLILAKFFSSEHDLDARALKLAESFFDSLLQGKRNIKFAGDDQTGRFYPALSRNAVNIDREEKSVFFDRKTAEIWQEK